MEQRSPDACSSNSSIPVLSSFCYPIRSKDDLAMTLRKFKIVRTSGDSENISIKTKEFSDCLGTEALLRKIFHNELIIGATINYSTGHTVRIDLETDM